MALGLPEVLSADDRHAAWVHFIGRIQAAQINQAWRDQMFRLVRAVFLSNEKLRADGGLWFNWMSENYAVATLTAVRRELDVEGSPNLWNLLDNIIQHPRVLTRRRYVTQWGRGEDEQANHTFDTFGPVRVPGSPADDHVDPAVVKMDRSRARNSVERVRLFAEVTRKSNPLEMGIEPLTVFLDEFHRALAAIGGVVEKYNNLLVAQATVASSEPMPQFDAVAAFLLPWVIDRDAVERIVAILNPGKSPQT